MSYGYGMADGVAVTISENPYATQQGLLPHYGYNDLCQGDYYNDGYTCSVYVTITLEERVYVDNWNYWYNTVHSWNYQLEIS